jgi:hypothetical protein
MKHLLFHAILSPRILLVQDAQRKFMPFYCSISLELKVTGIEIHAFEQVKW